ncbi:hypothetical protein SmJEL517_g01125 [Synchytrium microbalum]|uniref:AB hydrolase-1 domain-containing protein n=1 Tax=Synchytrium microbalum TaxID=1806994 RepID=A0A507CFI8_9FUNG|nr:uncharacterized protein SmJEL517_g01125 [Synchytrium microbalum]TPX36756.1 hypothetical protein SmJEL517_g01125 [Synchytrium microbalum]
MEKIQEILDGVYKGLTDRPILTALTVVFISLVIYGRLITPFLQSKFRKTENTVKIDLPQQHGQQTFRAILKPVNADVDSTFPLVVFECELGMNCDEWGFLRRAFDGILPTLSYDRLGYGGSSEPPGDAPREATQLAQELHALLVLFDVVAPAASDASKGKGPLKRPFVLVGHSYGGVISRTFYHRYRPPNLIGMVLLDSQPERLHVDNPSIREYIKERLPRAFLTAAWLSEIGFLSVLSFFGFRFMAITEDMTARLTKEEAGSLTNLSAATLRTFSRETAGVDASLSTLITLREQSPKHKKDVAIAVAVITTEHIEKPAGGERFDPVKWKEKWLNYQNEIITLENRCKGMPKVAVVDSFEHTSLCVSEKVVEAVSTVLKATMGLNIDIEFTHDK